MRANTPPAARHIADCTLVQHSAETSRRSLQSLTCERGSAVSGSPVGDIRMVPRSVNADARCEHWRSDSSVTDRQCLPRSDGQSKTVLTRELRGELLAGASNSMCFLRPLVQRSTPACRPFRAETIGRNPTRAPATTDSTPATSLSARIGAYAMDGLVDCEPALHMDPAKSDRFCRTGRPEPEVASLEPA
jgi:hypothetical protein